MRKDDQFFRLKADKPLMVRLLYPLKKIEQAVLGFQPALRTLFSKDRETKQSFFEIQNNGMLRTHFLNEVTSVYKFEFLTSLSKYISTFALILVFAGCTQKGLIEETLKSSIGSSASSGAVKINSGNASSTILTGVCDTEGAVITISGSASGTTTCQDGQWSVSVDVSHVPDGPVEFIATLTMSDGTAVSTILNGTKKTTQPVVTISTLASSVITSLNHTSFNFAGTCSENGKSVVISSGGFSDTTTCSGGTWSKNLNVSSLGEGNLSFNAKQTDDVGNTTTAFQTQTKDTVPPANGSTSFTGAPAGTNATTTLNVTVNGSGDATHYMFKVGVAASIDCSVITGYGAETAIATPISASISAIADGSVKLCAITRDTNGNYQAPAQAAVATWAKDADPPSVVISSSHPSSTNANPMTFTFTFSESVTGFAVGDITVGNGTKQNFSGSGTTYTVEVVPTAPGAVTVDVAGGVAQDAGANNNTAATQYSRTYDITQPTVSISSTAGASTNASPIPFTVTFSKAVTGFTAGDISSSNGLVQNFSGSGTTYTFDVPPTTDGAVNINIAGAVAQDSAGNDNTAATQYTRTYDTSLPTVVITATQTSPTNVGTINMTVTFNEPVSNFVIGDIAVVNGSKGALSGGPSVYTFDITPTANTTITVDVAAGVANDAATNGNTIATQFSIVHDNQAPTLTGLSDDTTSKKTKTWSWGCSETCTYRYVIDTSAATAPSGAYGSTVTDSQTTGTNTYYIHVEAKDPAGNTVVGHYSAIIDNTAPVAGSINDGNYLNSLSSSPSISWSGFTDNIAVHHYDYAIGSSSAGFDIVPWTGNGSTLNVTASGLSLTTNTTYYGSVRAYDEAGNFTEVNGNGWVADTTAPTVSSISAPSPSSGGANITFVFTVTYDGNVTAVNTPANVTLGGITTGCTVSSLAQGAANTVNINVTGCTGTGTMNVASLAAGTAQDAAGNNASAYSTASADATLVQYITDPYSYANILLMHFDGVNNDNGFKDHSATPNTTTINGNAAISGFGKYPGSGSAYFDGSGDFITIPDDPALEIGSSDFTIEAWVYLTAYSPSYGGFYGSGIAGKDHSTNGRAFGFNILGTSSSYTGFHFYNHASSTATVYNGTINLNQWYHMAATRTSGTVNLYLNGTLVQSGANATAIANTTGPITVGADSLSVGYEFYFPGYISDFRMIVGSAVAPPAGGPTNHLAAITNTKILLPFKSMNDSSGWRHTTQPVGPVALSTTQSKFGGASAAFNGSSTELKVPDSSAFDFGGSTDFTIESWTYVNATNTTGACWVCQWGTSSTQGWYFGSASPAGTPNTFTFSFTTNGAFATMNHISSNHVVTTGAWHHYAVSRQGSTYYMFVDGVLKNTVVNAGVIYNSADPVRFGNNQEQVGLGNNSWWFNGYLDDVRITKGLALYTANFSVPTVAFGDYQAFPLVVLKSGNYAVRFKDGVSAKAECWGGGGGGSGGNGGSVNGGGGGGGGGGAYASATFTTDSTLAYSLAVASGGAGGTTASCAGCSQRIGGNGTAGGTSSLGSIVTAAGGAAGFYSSNGNGDDGGAGGGSGGGAGSVYGGSAGSQASNNNAGNGGGGGSANGASSAVTNFGGAGGGGGTPAGTAGKPGGTGANGSGSGGTGGSGSNPGYAGLQPAGGGGAGGGGVSSAPNYEGGSGGKGGDGLCVLSSGFGVASLTPVTGSVGGFEITVYGSRFDSTTAVTVDGTTCTVNSRSGYFVKCTAPAKAIGSYDVVVSQTGETSVTLTNAISYAAGPTIASCSPGTYSSGKCYFDYSSTSSQAWTVPSGLSSVSVKMWGASGGSGNGSAGGAGGYVAGTLPVTGGASLSLYVASGGSWSAGSGGGGGATAISSGATLMMIAGGGGGSGNGAGGAAGGVTAENGVSCSGSGQGGGGASQSAVGGGGFGDRGSGNAGSGFNGGAGYYNSTAASGGWGYGSGGIGGYRTSDGNSGGGGGGYYGGGGGGATSCSGAGGGGSSWAHATVTNLTNTGGISSTTGNSADSDRGSAGNAPALNNVGNNGRIVISW